MENTLTIPQRPKRDFLPDTFTIKNKESIAPFYEELLEREITSLASFQKWMKDYSELYSVIGEEMRWKYINTSLDTNDKGAQAELEVYYREIEPSIKVYGNKILQRINECIYTSELAEDTRFRNFLKGITIDLSLFNETNIELQKEMSIKENDYSIVTGQWQIEHNGKQLTFQQARQLLKSTDRAIREATYKKITERRLKDEQSLDKLFTTLISGRNQIALNAGYKNYRDYAFDDKHRFDYTAEDCNNFHQSVSEAIVPLLDNLMEERKNEMGLETLKPWDTIVDALGRPSLHPFDSTDEFIDKTVKCLNRIDPYFGECLMVMKEMKHLDLESRSGKAPGGYNMSMPEIGVPFIFMNHANSEGDVRVMVHEGGHAMHSFLSHSLPYEFFKEYPSEVAELASMSMELFTMEHWEDFYENEDDLLRAKMNQLTGLLGTLPNVARGDDFQHWIYLNPNHTVAERKEKWRSLGKKYSSSVVDYSGLEEDISSSYQRILHFYQVPFYFIEYGFAQLGAIAMWKNYKENPEKTIEQYKYALSLGYTKSIPAIYEAAGIRFDFSKKYISELANFVQSEIEKLGK